jgi:hypothetical protein
VCLLTMVAFVSQVFINPTLNILFYCFSGPFFTIITSTSKIKDVKGGTMPVELPVDPKAKSEGTINKALSPSRK